MMILIYCSFLKNIQTAYIIKEKKEDDAELKLDDMGSNFDDDKLLDTPEMTK